MKKKVLYLLCMMQSISALAQQGYHCQGKFIELFPDSTQYKLIQTNDENIQKKLDINWGTNKISDNRFLISPSAIIGDSLFSSCLYKDREGNEAYILPRILLSMQEGSSVTKILNEMKGLVSLDTRWDGKSFIRLDCKVNDSEDVLKLVSIIEKCEGVKWCEPDMLCNIQFHSNTNPLFSQQYYLYNPNQGEIDINVAPIWPTQKGKSYVTVAVLDDGVDPNHEDFDGCVLEGYTVNNPQGKGYPQNANGNNPKSHGTACAGIIAAKDNSIGIQGIASGVKILPVNITPGYAVGNSSGFAVNSEIANAITWASERADILSCSFECSMSDDAIINAIDSARTYGRDGKGCIVVFSSGNDYPNKSNVAFPARIDGVIAVGAVHKDGSIWNYSQRGPSLDLVAPSGNKTIGLGDVVTTDRMGAWGFDSGNYVSTFGGTSAACPQVAGVAALMLSANPTLTETQVRTILQNTATALGGSVPNNTYGYGLVNAYAAVDAVTPCIVGPSSFCNTAIYSIFNLPTGATVTWNVWYMNITSGQGTGSITVSKTYDGLGWVTADIYLNNVLIKSISMQDIAVGTPPLDLLVYPVGPDGMYGWDFTCSPNGFEVDDVIDQYYSYYQMYLYKQNGNSWTQVAYLPYALSGAHIVYHGYDGWYKMKIRGYGECGFSDWWELEVLSSSSRGGGDLILGLDYNSSTETLTVRMTSQDEDGQAQRSTTDAASNCIVQLWDGSHMVKSIKTDQSECQMSLSGMHNGVYFVRVLKDGKCYAEKYVKN